MYVLFCSVAGLRFEWDDRKSASNKRKHGVSFEEAQTVFYDENALLIGDPAHSEGEDRFVLLGLSSALRLLVVCHCYRERDELIRIISARKADRGERAQYTRRLGR
jgi:uncharacterized DUF497 family protein